MTEWRIIPGTKYMASDDGQIRHLNSDKPRKCQKTPTGYLVVNFWLNGRLRVMTVHSLVAQAFLGPRPDGMEVRHLDGNRTNNRADNLQYGTKIENMADREAHGRTRRGEKNGNAVVSDFDVEAIRLLYAAGAASQYELATLFKTSQAQVHNIVRFKQRTRAA